MVVFLPEEAGSKERYIFYMLHGVTPQNILVCLHPEKAVEICISAAKNQYHQEFRALKCRYNENLSLCLTKHYEDVWGNGCTDPRFLDLGTS
jgi:hypothetical protein